MVTSTILMSLSIPDLQKIPEIRITELTICVEMENLNSVQMNVLKQSTIITSFAVSSGRQWFRLLNHYVGKKHHLHLDVVPETYFKKSPPKGVDFSKLQAVFDKLFDVKFIGTVECTFEVPMKIIPTSGLFRSILSINVAKGPYSLQMTGGKLSTAGGPIRNMEWEYFKSKDEMRIELTAAYSGKIDNDYIEKSLEIEKNGLLALVLGEKV